MEPVGIVVLIVLFLVVVFVIAGIQYERGQRRGEPTITETAEQKVRQYIASRVENLTNALKEKIPQDETIIAVVKGRIETLVMSEYTIESDFVLGSVSRPEEKPLRHGDGIFAATDKRLIMYQKESERENLRVFDYDTISAVETSRSRAGAEVIISSDEKMRIKGIKEQEEAVKQFTEYIRKKQVEDAEPSPSEPAPDIANQIRGLAELKDQGILTEEEFNSKKQDLLDRL